jgi:hypothetical protein
MFSSTVAAVLAQLHLWPALSTSWGHLRNWRVEWGEVFGGGAIHSNGGSMRDDPQSGPSNLTRRAFLRTTGGTAAAAVMAGYSTSGQSASPAEIADGPNIEGAEPKPATAATQAYLEQFSASLPFADREDFELATRGFVAAVPGHRIVDAQGNLLRDLNVEGFFSQPVPPTVHPSLWRNAGLVAKSGLFKVSDRVYQVRGVDYANMTIVLGETGFIIIDSLMIAESARAARGFGLDRSRCQSNTRVEARTSLAVSISEQSKQLQSQGLQSCIHR